MSKFSSFRDTLSTYFHLKQRGSSIGVEIVAGVTTFVTMSYIIFVQPLILSGRMFNSPTGMDFDALVTGTCVVAAFGSILMGVLANYPVALAPGMGENFYFTLVVVPACAVMADGQGWRIALGVVCVSGILFAILSFLNIRQLIMKSVSASMRHGIAAGIGLFVALIGLGNGGLIVMRGEHYMLTGNLTSAPMIVFFVGLVATGALHVLKFKGSILYGILIGTLTALFIGEIHFVFPFSAPPNPCPILARVDLMGVFEHLPKLLPFIVIFTFMDVFDTLGTLIGVSTEAGIMKAPEESSRDRGTTLPQAFIAEPDSNCECDVKNSTCQDAELPNSKRAFASDAISTVFGTIWGNSTVTAYIESAAGVSYGGRTGLTAVVTGICFLFALFLAPFVGMVANCKAITAPALVIVGAMMLKSVRRIDWEDYSELIPSFLILIGIPFTFSIGDGIMLGFIAYPIMKLFGGKGRTISWVSYLLGGILIFYFIYFRTG